ncbi:MAG: tetratricopeptide repeat protein [Candidatus Hydrogenedentes bacterium]|nr:tetratricopeptide repeat protein [Candidatus Hydrogenedentota bacterium]
MSSGKRHILIESVLLLIVAIASVWCGWGYVFSIDDAFVLRETKTLPIPVLTGAIHFALGRGVGVSHDREEGFPELEAFMASKISEIPRAAWPDAGAHSRGGGHYLYMHYYLIVYLGGIFYLLGISVWSFKIACVLLHALSMLAVYGIFRLVSGRLVSLLMTLFLSMSQAFLVMLTSLRDLGKAPFILGALLLTGMLVKRSMSPRALLLRTAVLGAVIGLGYGFRQDVFVCLPLAIFCVLAGARPSGDRPWLLRAAAALILVLTFTVFALPVFKGNREVGGTITVHTLFQGTMRCSEDNADFYSNSYDFGFLNYDHPVTAQIRAYAKRTGDIYPVNDLTPAYGEVGGRMFREFAFTWPGDLAGRVLAVADSLSGILATPFIWPAETVETGVDSLPLGRPFLEQGQRAVGRFFKKYGTAILLAALAFLAARSYKAAFFTLLFLGYFSLYPSTLFEYRHYFYVAFVPLFFAGLLASLFWRGAAEILRQRGTERPGKICRACLRGALRGGVFVGTVALLVLAALAAARFYQRIQWEDLLDRYAAVDLEAIPLEETREGDTVRLLLKRDMAELTGQAKPAEGEVASFYLAARFRGGERTVSFKLLNSSLIFSRTCTVILRGGGVYFFPVYDYKADTPFVFEGIEMNVGDRRLLEGVYLAKDADALRMWPYVFVPDHREEFAFYKSGRLDRLLDAVVAEGRGGFGLQPEKTLDAHLDLISRHPFDNRFAERALTCARHDGSEECLLRVWEVIGRFMPDRRSEASAWMAERAEDAIARGDQAGAIRLYEKASEVAPDDGCYREKTGALQESLGDRSGAIESYEYLLRLWPENPSIAYRLQALYMEESRKKDALAFWRGLAAVNPDVSTPLFYLGVISEELGALQEAAECYGKMPADAPLYPESVFRQGGLLIRTEDYEKGISQLLEIQTAHPEFTGRVENTLLESAIAFMEGGNHAAAVKTYEALLLLKPDSADVHVNLGKAYRLAGETEKARPLFERMLMRYPDSENAAKELDAIYVYSRADVTEEIKQAQDNHAERYWRTLVDEHPDTALPRLYLGITLERSGRLEAAMKWYAEALAIERDYAPALYRMGALDVAFGDVKGGLERIEQAAKKDPALSGEISRRCDELAAYCVERKRYDDARLLYETALAVSPGDLWPRVHLGELYELLGDADAALSCYRAVLMAVPDSPVTAKKMNDLLQRLSLDEGVAVAEWRAIAEKHPDAAIPHYYLGVALQQAGDEEGAVRAYTQAATLNPELPEVRERLDTLVPPK